MNAGRREKGKQRERASYHAARPSIRRLGRTMRRIGRRSSAQRHSQILRRTDGCGRTQDETERGKRQRGTMQTRGGRDAILIRDSTV